MSDTLPSIDDLLESKLPSVEDFIKEEELPSVDDFIEKEEDEEEKAERTDLEVKSNWSIKKAKKESKVETSRMARLFCTAFSGNNPLES